jgi:hypothetical protein
MDLGSTESLAEIIARDLPGSKGRPAREADNLIAICEPIFPKKKMWELRCLKPCGPPQSVTGVTLPLHVCVYGMYTCLLSNEY